MYFRVAFSGLVCLLAFSEAAKLPSFLKKCRQNDNACLKSSIQDGIKKLDKGLPSLGVPSLDPLLIPEMTIGAGSIVNVKQFYKNINITGTKDLTVLAAGVDVKKGELFLDMSNPLIKLEADYDMKGKVLVLPVIGHGRCTIILEQPTPTYKAKFELFERKGKKYVKITDQDYKVNAKFAKYYFENIFNGDERLGNEINKVLNDNWKEIYDELTPSYEVAIGSWLSGIANRFFSKVPVSEIFLPEN